MFNVRVHFGCMDTCLMGKHTSGQGFRRCAGLSSPAWGWRWWGVFDGPAALSSTRQMK